MGISSLGVGSGILTQDIIDQLKKADEAQRVQPITLKLANENDKKDNIGIIKANIVNLRDSINELQGASLLFSDRSATVSGTSVEVTADANSDIQDFTLNVTKLASKRIEESGTFGSASTPFDPKQTAIASGAGNIQFNVTGMAAPIDIAVDTTTTLDDIKRAINDQAGKYAQASIVQTATGEYNLFISTKETGAGKDISFTDSGNLLIGNQFKNPTDGAGNAIANSMNAVTGAEGNDASFSYNGQAITRSSNTIDDLVTGYHIKLKELGSSDVSVGQDRTKIEAKIDSFVEKYNAAISELDRQTKSSTDSKTRGIFSNNSGVRSLQRQLKDMVSSIGGEGGNLFDYGFDVAKDGTLSIDKTAFEKKLDKNPKNVQAFFSGGNFTKSNGNVVNIPGTFTGFYDLVNGYTKTNGGLSVIKESITNRISSLKDRKLSATESLTAKYEIMKKQFTAYNAIISKLNSASSMFVQLANAKNKS